MDRPRSIVWSEPTAWYSELPRILLTLPSLGKTLALTIRVELSRLGLVVVVSPRTPQARAHQATSCRFASFSLTSLRLCPWILK